MKVNTHLKGNKQGFVSSGDRNINTGTLYQSLSDMQTQQLHKHTCSNIDISLATQEYINLIKRNSNLSREASFSCRGAHRDCWTRPALLSKGGGSLSNGWQVEPLILHCARQGNHVHLATSGPTSTETTAPGNSHECRKYWQGERVKGNRQEKTNPRDKSYMRLLLHLFGAKLNNEIIRAINKTDL